VLSHGCSNRLFRIRDAAARLATAYRVREPARWRALATTGAAQLLERYEHHLASAEPKRCCVIEPGHSGPHDVIDPLTAVR
jgi:hypothetical protein